MNNIKLENKIISLIPSKTVKMAAKEQKYIFSEIDLVRIVMEFSQSLESMISLLLEIKKNITDDKIKKYITKVVNLEKKQYKLLTTPEEGYIYEVIMNRNTSERYLVPDFESAFITINNFFKHYKKFIDKNNNDYSSIEIAKRKISQRLNSREIDNRDQPFVCVLNNKRQIKKIYSYLNAVDIEKIGLQIEEIKYPDIFKAGDLVYVDLNKCPDLEPYRYINYYENIDGKRMYGINSFDNNKEFEGNIDVCCFLELSSEYVFYRKIELDEDGYCRYLMCHNHIDFGYLEKAVLDETPEKIIDDYNYCKTELIKLEYLNESHKY